MRAESAPGAVSSRSVPWAMIMALVQTAVLADCPYPRLRDAILSHPTIAEGLDSLFSNVPPRPAQ